MLSFGFQRNQAIQALREKNNNLEEATDWVLNQPSNSSDRTEAPSTLALPPRSQSADRVTNGSK